MSEGEDAYAARGALLELPELLVSPLPAAPRMGQTDRVPPRPFFALALATKRKFKKIKECAGTVTSSIHLCLNREARFILITCELRADCT